MKFGDVTGRVETVSVPLNGGRKAWFWPQVDITTYELDICTQLLATAVSSYSAEQSYNALLPEARRLHRAIVIQSLFLS